MSWDKTQPTDTTKLRNLGVVIRPNWEAIETADSTFIPEALNLADRTAAGLANDPTAIADTVILYSKQDASGDPQAYVIDPSSVITKLTGGSLTAAASGKLVLPNGLTFIWGSGTATGTFVTKSFDVSGFANNCFHVSGSGNGNTNSFGFTVVSKTQYSVKHSGSGAQAYFYFAIGN